MLRILGVLLAATATVVASAPIDARAQQPLRILVPIPPGGTSDFAARAIADRLKIDLGRPVIVENKAGGSGRIAVDALSAAEPNGATLLFAPIIVPVIGPLTLKEMANVPKKLAPVAHVAKYQLAFVVADRHPARDFSEFISWVQAHPEQANYGTPGPGSLSHFLGALIERATNTKLVHVPYRGVVQLETELIGGAVTAGISAVSDFLPLHRAGKLRILATSGSERSPLLPTVSTFREQGYRSVEAHGWHGIYAPAGTPQPIIERMSAVIVAAVQAPELRAKFESLGLEPTGASAQALAAIIEADTAYWRSIIKNVGFSIE